MLFEPFSRKLFELEFFRKNIFNPNFSEKTFNTEVF